MQILEEHLSTLVDGEEGVLGAPHLEDMANDSTARATWSRYHLIGDTIRDGDIGVVPPHFAANLAKLIESEPQHQIPHPSTAQPIEQNSKSPVIGLAIAASVALLAVIGVQRMSPNINSPEPALAVSATQNAINTPNASLVAELEPSSAPKILVSPEPTGFVNPQRRLNSYLVKFNEQRSSFGVPSINPYARPVGFEPE